MFAFQHFRALLDHRPVGEDWAAIKEPWSPPTAWPRDGSTVCCKWCYYIHLYSNQLKVQQYLVLLGIFRTHHIKEKAGFVGLELGLGFDIRIWSISRCLVGRLWWLHVLTLLGWTIVWLSDPFGATFYLLIYVGSRQYLLQLLTEYIMTISTCRVPKKQPHTFSLSLKPIPNSSDFTISWIHHQTLNSWDFNSNILIVSTSGALCPAPHVFLHKASQNLGTKE